METNAKTTSKNGTDASRERTAGKTTTRSRMASTSRDDDKICMTMTVEDVKEDVEDFLELAAAETESADGPRVEAEEKKRKDQKDGKAQAEEGTKDDIDIVDAVEELGLPVPDDVTPPAAIQPRPNPEARTRPMPQSAPGAFAVESGNVEPLAPYALTPQQQGQTYAADPPQIPTTTSRPQRTGHPHGESPEDIPTANEIDESGTDNLPKADPMDPKSSNRSAGLVANASLVYGLVVTIILIVLVLVMLLRDPESDPTVPLPAMNTSGIAPEEFVATATVPLDEQVLLSLRNESDTTTTNALHQILALLPDHSKRTTLKTNSVQRKALTWLIHDPNLLDYTPTRMLQRFVLATLFFSTGGFATEYDSNSSAIVQSSAWDNYQNWLSYYHHECSWFFQNTSGLYEWPETRQDLYYNVSGPCSENGQLVEHLWLWGNGLVRTIPDELYLMTHLKSISLWVNDYRSVRMGGTLSTHIVNLANLEALDLVGNRLTGTIPTEIAHLTKLEYLWLVANRFTGTIPTELGLLSNLEVGYMDTNLLTGTIPTELGLLRNVSFLWLYDNKLVGTLPTELGTMAQLKKMKLNGNEITGTLPTELGNLKETLGLYVEYNQLEGTIPTELGQLTKMSSLLIHNNLLTGTLATELFSGMVSSMKYLWWWGNRFSGTIPTEMGLLTELLYFPLDSNVFTGRIPSELGLLTNNYRFHLQYNLLTGSIPSEMGLMTTTSRFMVQQNYLTGSIPTELGLMNESYYLWLDQNMLSGPIPSEIGLMTALEHCELRNNSLTGALPSELSALTKLTSLVVDDTLVSGMVPDVFCDMENLTLGVGLIVDCENMDCACSEICVCGRGEVHLPWY